MATKVIINARKPKLILPFPNMLGLFRHAPTIHMHTLSSPYVVTIWLVNHDYLSCIVKLSGIYSVYANIEFCPKKNGAIPLGFTGWRNNYLSGEALHAFGARMWMALAIVGAIWSTVTGVLMR